MSRTMKAAFLPGNSTVQLREVALPEPGHGEVLIAVRASTICGSDIRAIYREHLGKGPERYQGVIAGHEPCGEIVHTGAARVTAIRATRKWEKMVMVGEGGTVAFNPSPDIIHEQKAIHGSWVTSTWLMEELVERLVRWKLHPEDIVTHRFSVDQADEAYRLMASGRCGKVAVCPAGE